MAVTAADLVQAFGAVAAKMQAERDALCQLDGEIGDGDHGVGMALGFGAVRDALAGLGGDASPTDVLNTAARSFLSAVGASTGPLYATALMRAGAAVKGRTALEAADIAALVAAMAEGVAHRGKAEPGQKTMLDAWAPAAEAAQAAPGTVSEVLAAAADAAEAGAEGTAAMQATMGRAARLGQRSLGHPDPGAVSAAMIVRVLADTLV